MTPNNWSYSWTDLPLLEGSGTSKTEYTYAVREDKTPANYESNIVYDYSNEDTTNVTITNTYDENCKDESYYIANVLQTEKLTLNKDWDDNNNQLNKRPKNLEITVNRDNETFTETLDGTTSHWTKELTLPKKKNSTYTASENLTGNDYEQDGDATIDTNVNGTTISFRNKLKTTSVTIRKKWNDGGITPKPESITYKLQRCPVSADSAEEANWEDVLTDSITAENTIPGEGDEEIPWAVVINNLPATYKYRVVEVGVSDKYYSKVTEENNNFTITNTLTWDVRKTSKLLAGEQVKNLQGAHFELKQGDTVIATGISGAEGIIVWTDKATGKTFDKSNMNGDYILHETQAPAGYMLSSKDWTLTFVNGLLRKFDGEAVTGNAANGVVVNVENEALYELPSTGGSGIYWYTIGGILLMLAAALILYKNRYKEVLRG